MLAAVAGRLRCPHCGSSLRLRDHALACDGRHSFDIARDGHVTLLPPQQQHLRGDTAEMVAARDAFLRAGHFAPIADAVADAAREAAGAGAPDGCVIDLGAGTGAYLARVLSDLPGWVGVALDSSRPALRVAGRADPRIATVACDVWHPLPIADGAADLVLDIFAPRNSREIARVLSADGALVVVTPTPRHLGELVQTLALLSVEPAKRARLRERLAPALEPSAREELDFEMHLSREAVRALVGMGPSAHHVDAAELERRLAAFPETFSATASVSVETFRPARR